MKVFCIALVFVVACLAAPPAHQNSTSDAPLYQDGSVLRITKERSPRVDGLDRLLFNLDEIEYVKPQIIRDLETSKMSREELESMLFVSLGENWADMVSIPTEDLTMIEALRLASHLNELNLRLSSSHGHARDVEERSTWGEYGENGGGGGNGGNGGKPHNGGPPQGPPACFCHGTAHHWPAENSKAFDIDDSGTNFHKNYPFMGIRLFGAHGIPSGHAGQHNSNPYDNDFRDCVLANEETDPELQANVRRCCHGFCVITGVGRPINDGSGLDYCDNPADDDKIAYANRYVCRKNCHLENCDCKQLTYGYHHNGCQCTEEWVDLRDDCDCETVLDEVDCDCHDILDIAEDSGCECDDALDYLCDNCDQALRAAYDYADCDCEDHISFLDDDKQCSCEQGAEYLCSNCCQIFDMLSLDNGPGNTGNCQRYGQPDSHAGYIAECCDDIRGE